MNSRLAHLESIGYFTVGDEMMTINQFIQNLQKVQSSDTVYNPYTDDVKANNLAIYLNYMLSVAPKQILVGEAPGYNGCRYSGVPFVDEYRLTSEGNVGCLPLQQEGYEILSLKPHKEQSAGIIWSEFAEDSFFPLLWNVFPFHPHEKGDENTNRTPTTNEVKAQRHFVNDILILFPTITEVYALGRTAEKSLKEMGIEAEYIRHPANGGATKCRERIREIS